jgi:MarR family transcriptional regulator, organic hydroperoxide resistance regulator
VWEKKEMNNVQMKPEDTIDFHIRWAWYNISRMYNMQASKFGGSMAIAITILNIEKDGTPSTKLAPKMGMEPRSLTRMIKSLEVNGVIEKRADKLDKRMVRLFLTKEGKKLRKEATNIVMQFNQKIREEILNKELEQCFNTLNKVNKIIDKNNIFN